MLYVLRRVASKFDKSIPMGNVSNCRLEIYLGSIFFKDADTERQVQVKHGKIFLGIKQQFELNYVF